MKNIGSSTFKFNEELLNCEESNQVNICIKNYNLPSGLSKRLFEPATN